MRETYLVHYGIRGQKWGIRRFQNTDGSYTSLGKRRRRDEFNSEDRKSVSEAEVSLNEALKEADRVFGNGQKSSGKSEKKEPISNPAENQKANNNLNDELAKKAEKAEKERKTRINSNKKDLSSDGKKLVDSILKISNIKKKNAAADKLNAEIAKLSTDELQGLYRRLSLENNYKKALKEKASEKGRITVSDLWETTTAAISTIRDLKKLLEEF